MTSICKVCEVSADTAEYTICVLRPIDITARSGPIRGHVIRYNQIGTHSFGICNACEKRAVRRRWIPVVLSCVLSFVFVGLLPIVKNPNAVTQPLLVLLVFLNLLCVGFLALEVNVHRGELASRRECVNRKLQKLVQKDMEETYKMTVRVDSGTRRLDYSGLQLVSLDRLGSMLDVKPGQV